VIKLKCVKIKKTGDRCQANALLGKKYCFWHSPQIKDSAKQEARSKGGKGNKIRIINPISPVALRKLDDVILLLEDTINRTRTGELDIKIANCLGYLSGQLIKAIEISDLEKRLEKIENAVLNK